MITHENHRNQIFVAKEADKIRKIQINRLINDKERHRDLTWFILTATGKESIIIE